MHITNKELREIKKMCYERMGQASYGLMYSTGQIIGKDIASQLEKDDFFQKAKDKLKSKDMVMYISFKEKEVEVVGSTEVEEGANTKTCSILEGALAALYTSYIGKKVYCEETECKSKGDNKCVFQIKEKVT